MSNPISEVHNCDCMKYMKTIPDKFFELAICDPPYGINVNMNAGRRKDTISPKRDIKKWDLDKPSPFYFKELFRVSKNQIIWGGNYFTDNLPITPSWIFWDKMVAEKCSFASGELAWTSFKSVLKKCFIPYSGFIGMEGVKFHPTTKPKKLYAWLLKNYATQGDKIFDSHLGSGSSRIAAYKMGFDFYACEIDEDYFNAQEERFRLECLGERKQKDGRTLIQTNLFE